MITMGLCSPRPHPNRVSTIKFLGTIRVATSQLPNHETERERERGRIIYENLAAWNPHTGSIIIIKACPSGLTRDYKKKRIKKKRVDERASEERKQKQKKSDCAFESSKDGYKLLPSKHVLLQFSSRVASKQSDYLVTYTLWQNGNAARGWRSVNRSFWRGKYHIQSGSLSLYPPQRLWYRMTPSFTAEVMSIACSCGRQSASLEIWETYSGEEKKKSYNSDCVSLTCHSFYSFPYGACVMYFFNALAELQKKKKKKVKYTVGACLCNRNHIPNLNPESLLSIQNHFPIGFLHFLSFGFMEIGHLSPHYCHIRYWDKYGACTWTNA